MNERLAKNPYIEGFYDENLERLLTLVDDPDFEERLSAHAHGTSYSARMTPESVFHIDTVVLPEEVTDDLFVPDMMDIRNFNGELRKISDDWQFTASFSGNRVPYKLVITSNGATLTIETATSTVEYNTYVAAGVGIIAGLAGSHARGNSLLTDSSFDDFKKTPIPILAACLESIGSEFGIYQSKLTTETLQNSSENRAAVITREHYHSSEGNRTILDIAIAASHIGETTTMSHYQEEVQGSNGTQLLRLSRGSIDPSAETAPDALMMNQILAMDSAGQHITPTTDPEQYRLVATNILATLEAVLD